MNVIEAIFKAAVTIVILIVIYWQARFLIWLWPTQIDTKATFSRIIRKAAPETDIVVARDPAKIYQNGEPVGEITSDIEENGNQITFRQISYTGKFKKEEPFEYGRNSYRVLHIERETGIDMQMTDHGIVRKDNVLENVVCEKLN